MSSTMSISEYSKAVDRASNALASGWSEAATRFSEYVAQVENGRVMSADEKLQALRSELGREFHSASQKAQMWADAAKAATNDGTAAIMDKYATKFAAQANAILDPALDARASLNMLAAEAKLAIEKGRALLGGEFGKAVGPAYDAYQMADGALKWARTGNSDDFGGACAGVVLSAGLGVMAAMALGAVAAPALFMVLGVGAAAAVGSFLGGPFYNMIRDWANHDDGFLGGWAPKMVDAIATKFGFARNWFPRRDPLTLDLDGDSLETIGINPANPILFDHDGDGLKTATGWVGVDDGFLALDRDGNGLIDDGTELFGDSTPILDANGVEIRKALDGFDALAAQDTNGDGLVNAEDANWADLRVWQDANSDGLTDEGELKTLESLDIVGFHVAKTENAQPLANGNQVADLGGFIKSDGTEGGMGAVAGEMGDINLADNPFYSQFTDNPPLTDVALGLPGMNGSGQVRDLQSASVLSPELTATLGGLAGYHTRAELLSQADALIAQWAATSGMQTGVQKAHSVGKNLIYLAPGQTIADLNMFIFSSGSGAPVAPAGFGQTPAEAARKAALVQAQADITSLIALLERFNGMTFVDVKSDAEIRTGANALLASYTSGNPTDPWEASWGISTPPYVFVPISTAQWNLLQQSYDALKQSVYDGLVMQTRLKPYLDTISLSIDDTGIQLDFAPLTAELQARFETQPAEAVRDLLDVQRVAGAQLTGNGWDGYQQLRGWLSDVAAMTDPAAKAALTATIIAGLNDFGYAGLRVNGDGTGGSEAVIGDDAGAVLNGNGGIETGPELRGKECLKSRRWRDGDVVCANGGWRVAA